MRETNILGEQAIHRLKEIITQDIKVINSILESDLEPEMSQLIESLLNAKKTILDIILNKNLSKSKIVSTASKSLLNGYLHETSFETSSNRKFISIFLKIEKDQMTFVKKILSDSDLPKSIEVKLESVLNKYIIIVDHLERSSMTNQLSLINI